MTDINPNPVSDFDDAVRRLSGGTNVAIYNDLGIPSIYVRRDKGLISDVIKGGSNTTHYAFKVNGTEIPAFYMGKYLATVYKGRALSLPLQDPVYLAVADSDVGGAPSRFSTFDSAKFWCEANGAGFHLPTLAEYAWIALLSRKNGTMPQGNNNYGMDFTYQHEQALGSYYDSDGKVNRTLTGSGPAKWNDNWKPDGISDLNGNVCEWQGGYRTVDGELQIFADNDAAMHCDQSATSSGWKAILQDGRLVEPGTDGSLKWDYIDGTPANPATQSKFRLNTKLVNIVNSSGAAGRRIFEELTTADGITIPELLKALALMPDGTSTSYGYSVVSMRNIGERVMYRGGEYSDRDDAGVFCANGAYSRKTGGIGFRPAFIPGI